MPLTVTAANQLISKIFRTHILPRRTTLYVSLHTANPTDAGSNEVTGGSYARQAVTFASPSSGATTNSGILSFTGMPATTATHYGVWSASTSGTLWFHDALTASKTAGSGDTLSFPASELDISVV